MTKTYNSGAYGIPAAVVAVIAGFSVGRMPLRYTRHSLTEALNDRNGAIPAHVFNTSFNFSDGWRLVEVEVRNGLVTKFLIRRSIGDRDLVMVVTPEGTVKTVWTNLTADGHSTLNLSNYSKP